MLNLLQLAPSHWGIAMGIYTMAFISHSATLAFHMVPFRRLAHNTLHMREPRGRYDQGKIPIDECEQAEALEKNQ